MGKISLSSAQSPFTGVFCALFANLLWGLTPLFWRLLAGAGPIQILAFRILGSLLFVSALLKIRKRTGWLRLFREPGRRFHIICASVVVTLNWGGYIWAVNSGHAVEASLGYYICPLLSIVLGMVFFRERLLPLQLVSFLLAVCGVGLLTYLNGSFPWISLFLALTFGLYGLFKKKIPADTLESLGAETLISAPLAVVFLLLPLWSRVPEWMGTDFSGLLLREWICLGLCGMVTVAPLFYYSKGARLLPLSALGFFQYVNPTLQLLIGVFVFHEPFPAENLSAFVLVWFSVALFLVSTCIGRKKTTS
ncbi:MAG: EamA family transporter RarD [Spirochaetaceae bacterium]|jgi:chloramphenicol-sensitive protein RarD|nr:EamA family transporter RarD [Spirochaetaceae bacterium]